MNGKEIISRQEPHTWWYQETLGGDVADKLEDQPLQQLIIEKLSSPNVKA